VQWQGYYRDWDNIAANPADPNSVEWEVSFWSQEDFRPGAAILTQRIRASDVQVNLVGDVVHPNGSQLELLSFQATLEVPFKAQMATSYWLSIVSYGESILPLWAWFQGNLGNGSSYQSDSEAGTTVFREADATFRLDGPPDLRGDFNGNGVLDVADVDGLTRRLGLRRTVPYDVDGNLQVDLEDHRIWVKDLRRTWFGDANLDGEFNSSDLVDVFATGQYEDSVENNSTWASGDWDADGDFTSGDLVKAFQDGGYEAGMRPAVAAVPEPSSFALLSLAVLWPFVRWRSRHMRNRGALVGVHTTVNRWLHLEVLDNRQLFTVAPQLIADFPAANFGEFTSVSQGVFFTVNRADLWKSDGTKAGTMRVADLQFLRYPTDVNGTLFFTTSDASGGVELWKSDGTPLGTRRVKDIRTGNDGSYPYGLSNVNNTLYFMADDGKNGRELWKSDGTEIGTQLVSDITRGTDGTFPRIACVEVCNDSEPQPSFVSVDDRLYFTTDRGLWRSDGTEVGTNLISRHSAPMGLDRTYIARGITDVNGTLFFVDYDNDGWHRVWKSDGKSQGTSIVKEKAFEGANHLTNVNGTLYFSAFGLNGSGFELWKSDGTDAGTVQVKDINPTGGSNPFYLTIVNGTL
jgi:ELWxxDGT repeat protein